MTEQERIIALMRANKKLVATNRQLRKDIKEVKQAVRWRTLTNKANKYDALLKKYRELMILRHDSIF